MKHSLLSLAIHAVLMSPTPGAAGGGSKVQVPGAPDPAAAPPASATPPAADPNASNAPTGNASDAQGKSAEGGPDPRDAEIASLRAQLAAAQAQADPSKLMVMEADGPNIRKAVAESKHRHLTAEELHKQVMSGKVKLTEHHVLCKDGWYVNPSAQRQANG